MTARRDAMFRGATEEVLPSESHGDSFAILTAVPEEPPPPGGYPVLYLLDGGAFFGTLVEMVRLRRNRPAMTGVEASVVVGIAHPGAHPYDRVRRSAEFTPGPRGRSGRFLDFLAGELHPFIEGRYDVDPGRRVLLGHSLAGAFVLEALAVNPLAHAAYVAISPSIWACRAHLLSGIDAVGTRLPPGCSARRVMVAVGQYDQEIAPWQRGAPDQRGLRARRATRAMVDEARNCCERLASAAGSGVDVRFELCRGEDHASVVPVALSRSLRFVAGVADVGAKPRLDRQREA